MRLHASTLCTWLALVGITVTTLSSISWVPAVTVFAVQADLSSVDERHLLGSHHGTVDLKLGQDKGYDCSHGHTHQ